MYGHNELHITEIVLYCIVSLLGMALIDGVLYTLQCSFAVTPLYMQLRSFQGRFLG